MGICTYSLDFITILSQLQNSYLFEFSLYNSIFFNGESERNNIFGFEIELLLVKKTQGNKQKNPNQPTNQKAKKPTTIHKGCAKIPELE